MPTVPTYGNFQTAPNVGGAPAFAVSSSPNAGSISADQTARFGQAVGAAGDAAARIAYQDLEEQNQVIAIGAVNQAKERIFDLTNGEGGFQTLKGINALQRPDGKDLATEYAGKFDESASQIADSLPNPTAKRMFQQQAANLRTSLYGQAQAHMLQESRTYGISIYDGAIVNGKRDIALNYTDVSAGGIVDKAATTIESAVRAKARMLGQSQEFADVLVRKEVSGAHVLAITAALENSNVAFADGYLKKYREQMEPDDILRVQGTVSKEMDYQRATQAVGQAMQEAVGTILPTDMTRLGNLVGLVAQAESGNKDLNADGSVVTSPKGAKGRMQVMDATNKNPGFGVKPAQDDSLEERARVGRDLLGALVRHYGSVPVALAAYNAGAGNVDKAIKAAEKAGNADEFMNYLPKPSETIPYVNGILSKFEAGQGRPRVVSKTEFVAASLQKLGAGASSTASEATRRKAEHQYEMVTADKKRADDEATANAMRAIEQGNTTWEKLPVNIRSRVPVEDIPKVIDFGKKVTTGTDKTNDALYLRLTDDSYLRGLDDNEFFKLRPELSAADFKHFANHRTQLRNGKAGQGPGELNTDVINETMRERLNALGINPSPKAGSADAARVGAIQRFVRDSIGNAQAQAGKKFDDVQTRRHIDGLFAKNTTFRTTFFGTPNNVPLLSLKAGDIPSDIKSRLQADFKANGINPNDAQLLGAYWNMTQAKNGGATGGF
ncbi:transglycosylase SLT domain-containing protein [Comamonas sp. C24C]